MTTATVNQMALVAVVGEAPPAAGGAKINQLAYVLVVREFVIPVILTPLPLGGFMATMPYYVGEFE